MNILEQIHDYLTSTGANDSVKHSGEIEFVRVTTPVQSTLSLRLEMWAVELWWSHHDGFLLMQSFESKSLDEACSKMLAYLKERDEPDKNECPFVW